MMIQLLVAHEKPQSTFVTVQFGSQLLDIIKGGIDAGHGGSYVEVAQVLRQRSRIGQHVVSLLHQVGHLMVQTGRQLMQLGAGDGQPCRNILYVVERTADCGIGKQRVDAGQDGVELGQHGLYLGNHLGSLAQGA